MTKHRRVFAAFLILAVLGLVPMLLMIPQGADNSPVGESWIMGFGGWNVQPKGFPVDGWVFSHKYRASLNAAMAAVCVYCFLWLLAERSAERRKRNLARK